MSRAKPDPVVIPSPPADHDCVDPLTEVAARWNLSVDSLRRAAQRGELKITRLSRRRVGVRRSEARRYLDSRTT
jgi:hypothetical protein